MANNSETPFKVIRGHESGLKFEGRDLSRHSIMPALCLMAVSGAVNVSFKCQIGHIF